MAYVNTRKACKELGVHPNTLRKWDKDGKIKTIRTPGGIRLYDLNSLNSVDGRKVIYARVSTRGQKNDLENQIKYLRTRYPDHELIEDIGSGLNFKRKGLRTLLDGILAHDLKEIVVTHRDRLTRFGFEMLEYLANKNGCRILVLNDSKLSPQEELVQDLLSIIHVFSSRLYGLRKYSHQIKEDSDLPGQGVSKDGK